MDMCCTDVDVHEFEYKWTITNLSLHMEHAEDEKTTLILESSSFSAIDIANSKWHIELIIHCNTDISKDYVGLSIVLDSAAAEVLASQTYFFVCTTGTKHKVARLRMHKFTTPLSRWGNHQVYRKKKLLKDASIYLPNDQLTIVCQVHIMGKPIISGVNSYFTPKELTINDLSKDLGRLLADEKLTDVTFLLCDEKIRAHKNILTARSPVFSAMFEHEMREKNENAVIIDDIDPEIFKQLLYYMYTNEVRDIGDIAMDLLPAADKYGLEKLKAMCGESIYKQITIDNAVETLIFADLHSDDALIKYTQNFINAHIADVIKTPSYEKLEKHHPQLAVMLYRRLATKIRRKKISRSQDKWLSINSQCEN